MTMHDGSVTRGETSLQAHARECSECRLAPADLGAIAAALDSVTVETDVSALSRRVLASVRPEMQARAARAFKRRVGRGVLAAALPLPLVAAVDILVLRAFHALLGSLLPETLATFVTGGMALSALLVVAASYAAIPLLVDRQVAGSRIALA